MKRLVLDLALFLSVFLLPYSAALAFGVLLFFLFRDYYELLLAGLLFDLFYGAPVAPASGFHFIASLIVLLLAAVLFHFKGRLRGPVTS